MAKNIRVIPSTVPLHAAGPVVTGARRRVAAYARVSTDKDEQFTSYEAQIDYYTNYIKGRPDWEFVSVYSDEGKTGCNTSRREGFKRMVDDALDGKIDLIVTKSVSRFARNTVDSLTTIRKLKDKGVEVYFEKENIWTFDGKGELMLTIMSSLAQEESRSISENCAWGQRKRFADGKVSVPFGRFLGYDRGPDGNLVVNEEQAKVVRRIYAEFLRGYTPYAIANHLTADGIPTPGGKTVWGKGVVLSILTNEKYKGDALLQKVFTEDFISKKKVKNTGQVPQYYVEGNHEAIVSAETFDLVQEQIAARKPGANRYSGVHLFSGIVYCGDCGSLYGSKVWHATDKYRKVVWQCNHKYEGAICRSPHMTEPELEAVVVKAMGRLSDDREEIIRTAETLRATVYDTTALCAEQEQSEAELAEAARQLTEAIMRNASVALDQAEHQRETTRLSARYQELQDKNEALKQEIREKISRRRRVDSFIRELKNLPQHAGQFDPVAFRILVERITVYEGKRVVVRFNDGSEIEA
ncbi:MAG: recombinase family protein [Candidatus Ventricola sp.]